MPEDKTWKGAKKRAHNLLMEDELGKYIEQVSEGKYKARDLAKFQEVIGTFYKDNDLFPMNEETPTSLYWRLATKLERDAKKCNV